MRSDIKVALVHDWLTGMRGGERVLEQLCVLFPDADLYTLFHEPGSTSPRIETRRVFSSPLDRPALRSHYRRYLPLFPWAIRRLRAEDYDLIVSTHHAVAKAIPHPPEIPHLCYCFTPMRYIWDQADAYLGRGWKRAVATPLVAYLRHFDRRTSRRNQVTRFVGISRVVNERIRRHYDRDAGLVYPPVSCERFEPGEPEDFYLLVGGFVPYKREDVAVEAFRDGDRRLLVAGDGPTRREVMARAPQNVEWIGRVSDEELAGLYRRCRALIYPQEEDFGIVPLEAQASGRPVIAFGRGGATETVVPLGNPENSSPTGVWFPEQTSASLREALSAFEANADDFSASAIRRHAETFDAAVFRREMLAEVTALLSG